ncbi:MAG TPA: L-seryl-tRNA(Sec) selenium transferase [Candidatus Baltobacteraceae bacterium]|nr:L-seryl-tRNA(Sec) selenium transferase [Candidatus Baltobacteraceae bacterium]
MSKRQIPAVNKLLEDPSVAPYEVLVGRDALRELIAAELDRVRAAESTAPFEAIVEHLLVRLQAHASASLHPVVNATGVLLHTNLGRAPVAAPAFDQACAIAQGYSNLEFDLDAGERGSRYEHAGELLRRITGAQDALVVNNCAAAILLILDTFARGGEVVLARNQLIEIGGGFRLPDVLARSGARLIEVGTTNKIYLHDYERALSPKTMLLMRSHQSNYSIEGFVHDVAPAELAALGRRMGVAVVEDLGSGALVDLREYGLPHERTVQDALADGISLVAFSGDKLLGGPQAGIIAGTRAHVARLRSNPLLRALRVDKVTLALLSATLRLYASKESRELIPFYRMLALSLESLRARAARIAATVPALDVVETEGRVGGGSLPHARIASIGLARRSERPDALAARLRAGNPPVVARIDGERVVLDLRTVEPEHDDAIGTALARLGPAL